MRLELDLDTGDERMFVDEAVEHIDRIEQGLLDLERAEPGSPEVNEVFRSAHTLKGSAATIAHRRMAELTHAMENVFGALRSGTIESLAPFADTLLETIDVLRMLVDEVGTRETITDQPEVLAGRLRAQLEGATGASTPVASPEGARTGDATTPSVTAPGSSPAPAGDGARTEIRCEVDASSDWHAVRLLQAVIEADESTRLISSAPDRATIETGTAGSSLVLTVAGAPADLTELLGHLATIDELHVAAVEPVAGRAAEATAAYRQADAPEPQSVPTERRQADLGVEARGTAPDERLALAGDRLRAAQQTIRIDVARLDDLMNLIGELVVHKTRLLQQSSELRLQLGDDPLVRASEEGAQLFARIAGQLQDQVTRLRMLPVETVFNRFPRAVRDLASKLGKDVELVIEGKETELDRSVLDEVGDPLGHLLRNAVDHGLESSEDRVAAGKSPRGTIRLGARHADGQILITVEDDGRGIDPGAMRRAAVSRGVMGEAQAAALSDAEAIDLIFEPGFSTAKKVTDVSGRGVGLDVVRTNVERLGGRVCVVSHLGQGARFELSLPLTLAIVSALLVRSGQRVCAMPLAGVVETLRVQRSAVSQIRTRPAIELRGRVVGIERLDNALGDPRRGLEGGNRGFVYLVVVRSAGREMALAVDGFLGEHEIVLKSLGTLLGRVPGVAGATVLGDGSVALVIDTAALIDAQEAHARASALRRTA